MSIDYIDDMLTASSDQEATIALEFFCKTFISVSEVRINLNKLQSTKLSDHL